MSFLRKEYFKKISDKLFSVLLSNEKLSLELLAEDALYVRISQSKIRQQTKILQAYLNMTFWVGQKSIKSNVVLSGEFDVDITRIQQELKTLREWCRKLPESSVLVFPESVGNSEEEMKSDLPSRQEMVGSVLRKIQGSDFVGIFFHGTMVRGNINSAGQFRWFTTENYYFSYSVYAKNSKAVKGMIAGNQWSEHKLELEFKEALQKLAILEKESYTVPRGAYRVYLEPMAVDNLLSYFSGSALSMGLHQRGSGYLEALWKNTKKLSTKFSLFEDFSLGLCPRFNEVGELAEEKLSLIEAGAFCNFLVNGRTAKEFNVVNNFANQGESMRSPVIATGSLKREDILKKLEKGLYLSNLHYLNWSDRASARITGMTRYACFWVENGEIVAPIKDLRLDESLYHIFGDGLMDLTDFSEVNPRTASYTVQTLGGTKVPGILVDDFKFTL